MKKFIFCAFALCWTAVAHATTFDYSDIQYWVGTGSNQAAFVIDWNDGTNPESLVWGFRWSGDSLTVLDMIKAIDASDIRLSIAPHPLYSTAPGFSIYSIYYDLTGLGGTPTIGTPQDLGGPEGGSAPFAGDHYQEGWYTGFWGELTGVGNPYAGGSWDSSYPTVQGVGFDALTNNSWWGLSYTPASASSISDPGFPVAAAVPAPEPSSACLLAVGALGLINRRKRSR
jgi:hypothetical protein